MSAPIWRSDIVAIHSNSVASSCSSRTRANAGRSSRAIIPILPAAAISPEPLNVGGASSHVLTLGGSRHRQARPSRSRTTTPSSRSVERVPLALLASETTLARIRSPAVLPGCSMRPTSTRCQLGRRSKSLQSSFWSVIRLATRALLANEGSVRHIKDDTPVWCLCGGITSQKSLDRFD